MVRSAFISGFPRLYLAPAFASRQNDTPKALTRSGTIQTDRGQKTSHEKPSVRDIGCRSAKTSERCMEDKKWREETAKATSVEMTPLQLGAFYLE